MDTNNFDASSAVARIMAMAAENAKTEDEIDQWEQDRLNQERRKRLTVLETWGVPRRALDALKAPRETQALAAVRRWWESDDNQWCQVLSSSPGLGKSVAAAYALFQHSEDRSPSGHTRRLWWPASTIARVDGYDGTLDALARVGVLVVDDLGVEYSDKGGHLNSRLDELLDARYANYRRTIITTNLGREAFKARLGERVVDRIREAGPNAFLELRGKSMRGAP